MKFVFWLIFYVSLILFTVLIVIGVGYVVITVLGAVLVIFFFAKGIEKVMYTIISIIMAYIMLMFVYFSILGEMLIVDLEIDRRGFIDYLQ